MRPTRLIANLSDVGGIPTTEPRGSETTAQQIHKEGTQYVKEATQANQQSMQRGSSAAEGTGMDSSPSVPQPIRQQPAASNPGVAPSAGGGMGEGAGGVSSTSYRQSPVESGEQQQESIVDTVKHFLGFGTAEEKRTEDTQPAWNKGNVTAPSELGATTAAPAVAGAAAPGVTQHDERNTAAFTADIPDRTKTKPSASGNSELMSAAGYSISTGPDYTDSGRSEALGSTNTSTNSTTSAYPSTSTNPVSTAQDPAAGAGSHSTKPEQRSDSSANNMGSSEPRQQSYEDSTEKSVKHEKSDEDKHSKAHKGGSSKAENPDSIPTAGGEKLGEKHWGESQIVPELPPKRGSDAGQGVSSSDGQPTCESEPPSPATLSSCTDTINSRSSR